VSNNVEDIEFGRDSNSCGSKRQSVFDVGDISINSCHPLNIIKVNPTINVQMNDENELSIRDHDTTSNDALKIVPDSRNFSRERNPIAINKNIRIYTNILKENESQASFMESVRILAQKSESIGNLHNMGVFKISRENCEVDYEVNQGNKLTIKYPADAPH